MAAPTGRPRGCGWRSPTASCRLPVGSRLPATRSLAAELGVSRGVVTEAYRRLTEDRHVAGRGHAGTVVVAAPPPVPARPPTREPVPAGPPPGSTVFTAAPGPDVFGAVRAVPARIDLSPGVPDLAAFPRASWLRAERAVPAELPTADLGYGDPHGAPALRLAVANRLARDRGIRADPDEIVIVAGTAGTGPVRAGPAGGRDPRGGGEDPGRWAPAGTCGTGDCGPRRSRWTPPACGLLFRLRDA